MQYSGGAYFPSLPRMPRLFSTPHELALKQLPKGSKTVTKLVMIAFNDKLTNEAVSLYTFISNMLHFYMTTNMDCDSDNAKFQHEVRRNFSTFVFASAALNKDLLIKHTGMELDDEACFVNALYLAFADDEFLTLSTKKPVVPIKLAKSCMHNLFAEFNVPLTRREVIVHKMAESFDSMYTKSSKSKSSTTMPVIASRARPTASKAAKKEKVVKEKTPKVVKEKKEKVVKEKKSKVVKEKVVKEKTPKVVKEKKEKVVKSSSKKFDKSSTLAELRVIAAACGVSARSGRTLLTKTDLFKALKAKC